MTNGVTIIPFNHGKRFYVFFGRLDNQGSCSSYCLFLTYTQLELSNNTWVVKQKNIHFSWIPIQEKILLVKHANGIDWWLIAKKSSINTPPNNTYIKYLVKSDTIIGPYSQDVGYHSNDSSSSAGELVASRDGKHIANCFFDGKILDIYSFDRCTGMLSLKLSYPISELQPYCFAFSPNGKLGYVGGAPDRPGGILQLSFDETYQVISKDTVMTSGNGFTLGQMELGLDNKIYVSTYSNVSESKYLHIIHSPDSMGQACNFEYMGFYLGDSSEARASLPNMPNYNLIATSIFQADAGMDTFYCQGDTTIKAVTIGQEDTIPGVTYNWLNVDSTQQHRPKALVKPDSSTWFYLELTDTSIQGSCTTRIDSVFVEVRNCTGIYELGISNFKLYPNPVSTTLTIESVTLNLSSFKLYSLLGELVLDIPLKEATSTIDLSTFQSGLYFYSIFNDSGKAASGKLMIQ